MIAIIDYGLGNLPSVKRAIKKIGYDAIITSDLKIIEEADILILPGVGSFKAGMDGLNERNFTDLIKKRVNQGIPILGICLGMQLFFSRGLEFGDHEGLSLIEGVVKPLLDKTEVNEENYRVPHIGWNSISIDRDSILTDQNLIDQQYYFVHSFYGEITNSADLVAHTTYGNQKITAIIQKDNIYGTQFHPEKSGKNGLNMLKNFIETHITSS